MVRSIRKSMWAGLVLLGIAASQTHAADYAVPDKAKALESVKALVTDAAKSGKKVYVWVTIGTYVKAQLSQADDKSITVISEGNDFNIKWDKIPQEQIPTIIKNCWQDDAKHALVGMDYCMATGQLDKAEEFMTLAAGDSKALGDDLKGRIKALGGLQDAAKIAADPQLAAAAALRAAAANKDKDDTSYKGPEKIAYRPSEYGYLNPIKDVAAAVDNSIEISLAEQGIRPEPICDDTTFLRRISLDLTGEIPSTDEVLAFLKDGNSAKRSKWIEEMSKRPEYADHWATFWSVLLVGRRTKEEADVKPHYFRSWLREQFSRNEKWDKIVTQILTATGENDKDGASSYLTFHMNDTLPITIGHISQTFLGARIACAQCHDHPFDKWTQQDFWGFSAFLANTRSERKELRDDPNDAMKITRQWHILVDTDQRNGGQKYDPPLPELKLPPKVLDGPIFTAVAAKPGDGRRDTKRGKDMASDKKMDADKKMDKSGKDMASNDMKDGKSGKSMDKDMSMSGSMDMAAMMSMDDSSMMNAAASGSGNAGLLFRKAFAAWVTSPKNEKFNQSAVNRIWRDMFGYGLVEPVDDIRPKNPPVYPEVMKILSEDFNASGRDLQRLVTIIANTRAYQRSSIGTLQKVDRVKQVRNFARAEVRPMTPEEFFMAVIKATAGDETAKHMEDSIRRRDANSGYGGNMMAGDGAKPPPAAGTGKGGKGAMASMPMGMGGDLGEYTRLMERFIGTVGSSRVDLQACKLEYSIVSPK